VRPGSLRPLSPEITTRRQHCIKRFSDVEFFRQQVDLPDYLVTERASAKAVPLGSSLAWHMNTSQILVYQGIRDLLNDFLLVLL
jgi:hypothetical protein